MDVARSFDIPKKLVWQAYLHVKKRAGGAGVDSVTMEAFEENLKDNLYRIWNRMSSGSYFPPPVLRVEIPKRDGGVRCLGIPTVADRIAQATVKLYLEPSVEPKFHPDSFGYRPGRSAIQAIALARKRSWRYDWILDLDVRRFFDTLDHDLVMRAVKRFTSCPWVLLYIGRWLIAPVKVESGALVARTSGTPQGGVISPLIANIFLHLAFDKWMQEEHPSVPFERYADDVLVHCRTKAQAEHVRQSVEARLRRCKLELHPLKTKVVYCKDSNRRESHVLESLDFLGFTFRPRRARNRRGVYFVSFSPAVSRRAAKDMRQTMRRVWRIGRRTDKDLTDLAKMYNPVLRGWIAYYGAFRPSELHRVFRSLDRALVMWAMRKFKRLRGRKTRAGRWLERVQARQPGLFVHWPLGVSEGMTG